MGGHHRERHAVAVAPVPRPEGDASVTTGPAGGVSDGRRRAGPDALTIEEFNGLDASGAAEVLGACLDIPEWIATVASGRPYRESADLYAAGAAAAAVITWPQVSGALDRHPRIGQRRAAAAGGATEQAWSATEQSGVADQHAQALATGNADYEQRFGHLFLICASGLTGDEILAALHARLSNAHEVERDVVTDELRKIAALRLAKAVAS
jgi:2-oxo-4-hydroxy-4-carboxy-5-ureidoimidazoline decarboxylase